jgi:tellurite resistance protein
MQIAKDLIQCRRDRDLRTSLMSDSGVKLAQRKVDEHSSGYGFYGRRRLLAGALRIKRAMFPSLADTLQQCREILGVTEPLELYVKPDSDYGAFVMKSPTGPWALGVTSALVEKFNPAELRFVIGHELGHMLFDHTSLPMPSVAMVEDMAGTIVSRQKAIELYLWCRSAEISADRAGLACGGSLEVAASSFLKLSSGLAHVDPGLDVTTYIAQVDSLASSPAARQKPRDDDDTLDCFSTHPYAPLRLRALAAFARSDAWQKARGGSGYGAVMSLDDAEQIVERDLELMEASYLEEKGDEPDRLRRVLFLSALVVAWADGTIDPREQKAVVTLLGDDSRHDKKWSSPDLADAKTELEAKLKEASTSSSLLRRTQLVQHLTIVAAADGTVTEHERDEMEKVARALQVPVEVIDHTLHAAAHPMD